MSAVLVFHLELTLVIDKVVTINLTVLAYQLLNCRKESNAHDNFVCGAFINICGLITHTLTMQLKMHV